MCMYVELILTFGLRAVAFIFCGSLNMRRENMRMETEEEKERCKGSRK